MFNYFKELYHDKQFVKTALAIAIPLMLQQLVVSSVNLVDNLMVGQLGDAALAGVSNANRFYMVMWFGIGGGVNAAVIYLSQFNGAKDYKRMKETFRFMLVLAFSLCAFFFSIAISFPEYIISFFIKDADVIRIGSEYLRFAAFTYIPSAMSLCMASAIRATGETKIPLKISVLSVLINTSLNYCLIFGNFGMPRLGAVGAAIATLCARLIEFTVYLVVLKCNDFAFKTRIINVFKFEKDLAKHIIKKAVPLFINEILFTVGMSTLLKTYSTRGLAVNTAYSMSATIADLFFVLFAGMSTAATVLVGTSLGANRLEEGKHNGYKLLCLSLVLALFFLSLMFICSFFVPYLYNVSEESKHLSASFLRVMALFFVLYMFNTSCYFILRSGGDTKNTLYMDSGFMWLCNIPLVMLLAYFTNIDAIVLYTIGQATDIPKCFLSYKLLKKEKWVNNIAQI